MSTISAFKARARFEELLKRVASGEEIIITRRGKPVARLIPAARFTAQEAVTALRANRAAMARRRGFKPLTDREIIDAIAEGR